MRRIQYLMSRWAMQTVRHMGPTVVIGMSLVILIMLAVVLSHVGPAAIAAVSTHSAHAVAAVTPDSICINLPVPC